MAAQRTLREQLLLGVAAIALITMSYAMLRYHPTAKRIDGIEADTQATRAQMDSITVTPPPTTPISELRVRLEQVENDITSETAHRAILLGKFANDERQRQVVHMELAELAEQTGVRVRERKPQGQPLYRNGRALQGAAAGVEDFESLPREAPTAASSASPRAELPAPRLGPFVEAAVLQHTFDRRLERLVVESSYESLLRFLQQMDKHLSYRVVVVSIDIEADRKATSSVLNTTLIVAL